MNSRNSISDEDFTNFLQSLGVEAHGKSFEWMLTDHKFGDVLSWLYKNLDENNALTAREDCRYAEIEKKGLPSSEDLEVTLSSIQQEYTGICLPGDQDSVEDMKLDIIMQKEKLTMLEREERVVNELVRQNEITKQELDLEIKKLNAAYRQSEEDELAASQECLRLAEDVESITAGVVDIVAETLHDYGSCYGDKDIAKRFLAFGPLDTYRRSQALFRSHFNLYISKKCDKRRNDGITEDLRITLAEAKILEERLSDALRTYIESKAELSAEQAKLALVTNYDIHSSPINWCPLEAQSALELLEQEESILEQQLQAASGELVSRRTNLAFHTAFNTALLVRQQMLKDLTFLLDITQQALAMDRLVYGVLRHELRCIEELIHFAAHLRHYVIEEKEEVATRVQSMNEICAAHKTAEQALETSDYLLNTLIILLGADSRDPDSLMRRYNHLRSRVAEYKYAVLEGFAKKEQALEEYKASTEPLLKYIFDGSTKQPNCCDTAVASMSHALRSEIGKVEKVVQQVTERAKSVQDGDKRNLRKLWQWFLTDPARLHAAIKNVIAKK